MLTERDLRSLLGLWQRRLSLDHWFLVLKVGGCEDASTYMEVHRSTVYQRAVVHCQPWMLGEGEAPEDVLIRGDDLTDSFVEESLVHELLHLHTRDMRAIVRDDLDGQVHRDVYTVLEAGMSRAEEQCVDRLASALVRAFAAVAPAVTTGKEAA